MRKYINAVPAYGADYTSKAKVMEAWHAGKDFLAVGLMGTGYFNKDSFRNETEPVSVELHYSKQMKVMMIQPETKNQKEKVN